MEAALEIQKLTEKNQILENLLLQREQIISQKEQIILQIGQTVVEKEQIISKNKQTIVEKEQIISQKEQIIAENLALIEKYKRMLFGQKRERFTQNDGIQLSLFDDELSPEEIKRIEAEINAKKEQVRSKEKTERPKRSRTVLPKHLEIIETTILPTVDITDMIIIRVEISEYLDYQPSKHYICRILRPVYAPKTKEGAFAVAAIPDVVFEKSKVAVGMVAHLLYSKFVMHLPLDRQLKELERQGIPCNSSTIYSWTKIGIERLAILYEFKKQQILQKKYLHLMKLECPF